ncbi:MAG: P-loop NTPase [Archaeoglobaceae archaeon]
MVSIMNPMLEFARKKFSGKKVLAVLSSKGGVGKSTLASLLALSLSEMGSVALLDLDIYGNSVTKLFGMQNKLHKVSKEGIEPFKLKKLSIFSINGLIGDRYLILPGSQERSVVESFMALSNVEEDTVIIDMPPGMGEELLTLTRIVKPEAIVVTLASKLSIDVVRKMLEYLKESSIRTRYFIVNMAYILSGDRKIYPFGSVEEAENLSKLYNLKLKVLPMDPEISKFIGQLQYYDGILKKEIKELECLFSDLKK